MKSHRVVCHVALMLACAAVVSAQQVGDTQLFPVISATPGLGDPPTQWVSDVTVYNLNDAPITVGFQFFREGQANTLDQSFTGPTSFVITLAAGETRLLENIVRASFGITTAVKGMLLVTCSDSFFASNPESAQLLATSRTYNVGSPAGTYGQTVTPNFDLANPFATPTLVTGALESSRFRSNLGVGSIAMGGPVTIHYRVLRADGSVAAAGTRTVEALSMRQWSFASLGVAKSAQPLTVEVRLDPADVTPDPCGVVSGDGGVPNAIFAYVSKVDGNPQGTGDAEFIPGVPIQTLNCPNR